MKKLTNDQLEVLVQKRNEAGLKHTVEVMNNEELAAYKINCQEAIERLTNQINKAKEGGSVQQSLIENKEMLEGFIAYIDSKLNEQPENEVVQYKLVKINSGSSIHLAEYFETPSGVTGYDVNCGSGKTGLRAKLYKVNKEVNIDNITCNKCKKAYQEMLTK